VRRERFPAQELPILVPERPEDEARLVRMAAAAPELVADTETTGLRWWAPGFRPFMASFCDGISAWALDLPEDRDAPLCRDLREAVFGNAFQQHCYHNAKFDLLALRTLGIEDAGEVHDTMLMASLIDERDPKSLAWLAENWLEGGVRKEQGPLEDWFAENKVKKDERDYSKAPRRMVAEYAAHDAQATWFYWMGARGLVLRHPDWGRAYQLERAALRALVDVEGRGYVVDAGHFERLEPELAARVMAFEAEVKEGLSKSLGRPVDSMFEEGLNLNSNDQLLKVFEALKADLSKLPRTEKSGKPSLGRWGLEKIGTPEALRIAELLETKKLLETFVKNVRRLTASDGAVHGSFNQVGAATGRMSSSDPNMQNMPVEGGIRDGFVCRPGFTNLFFDYKQIEMAVLAHYCDDGYMREALERGGDLHTATAALLFSKRTDEVAKEERKAAKTINFAIVYGAGAAKVASQLGWDMARTRAMMDTYYGQFPGVKDFRDRASAAVRRRGYVKTMWGRWRRLEAQKSYVAVNSIVQGTATGDLCKASLARVWAALKGTGASVISVVHDEFHVEAPYGEERRVVEIVTKAMEDWPQFRVPIKVDVAWTRENWAAKRQWPMEGKDLGKS
jgi:DNA polymerase-1